MGKTDLDTERIYYRVCSKCNNDFRSNAKYSKVCAECTKRSRQKIYDGSRKRAVEKKISNPKNKYVYIYMPKHRGTSKKGFIAEHRLIVEGHIGRLLKKEEVVHHINFIKNDNRIKNLMLFKNESKHIKFHIKMQQFGMTNPIKRQIENRWKEYNKK